MESGKNKQMGLSKWIWKVFYRVSLLPLIVIEIIFISVYFMTNTWHQSVLVDYTDKIVDNEMNMIANAEAATIAQQFESISEATQFYALQLTRALDSDSGEDANLSPDDLSRLYLNVDGIYSTSRDSADGGAAVFYSGIYPIGDDEMAKAKRLLGLQEYMKDFIASHALANQIYINTFDSLNIIYPYFDVLEQYPPYMDIPSYNFYYEADLEHNPDKKVVWTDSYLDPAGRGWMASAIVPVYRGDFLEGVAGVDVTVSTIIDRVLSIKVPYNGYGVLVGKDGMMLAIPPSGESDWGVDELTDHNYQEAILQDTFKPDAFNLFSRTDLGSFVTDLFKDETGNSMLTFNGETHEVSWSTIDGIGWKLLILVPTDAIYAEAHAMQSRIFTIGSLFVLALLFIYLIYYATLFNQARKQSKEIALPLEVLNEIVFKISQGDYFHEAPDFTVRELSETAYGIARMGHHLGEANAQLMSTQKQLIQSQTDLEALVAAVDDIVIECRVDGIIINQWSDKMSLLNEPAHGDDPYSLHTFFGDDIAAQLLEMIRRIVVTGKDEGLEFAIDEKGFKRWYQAKVSRIDKTVNTYVISARDITSRIQMEQAVIASKEIAEQANLAKSEFISGMSHELKTPLNAVLGFAQVLALDHQSPLNESQRESVEEIIHAGTHLLELINNILDFSRVEAGRIPLDMEAVQMCDIFEEVQHLVQAMAKSRNITIEMSPENHLEIRVLADRLRLKQVLINLLTNAIKYNRSEGKVSIACERLGHDMRFHIYDTGLGIEQSELYNIFTPFYRIQNRDAIIEGTGIGLSVTKDLIEAMEGHIGVESQIGQGSHFWFDLKIAEESSFTI